MENREYQTPEIEIIEFDCDDIIRTSAEIGTDDDGWFNQGDGFGG